MGGAHGLADRDVVGLFGFHFEAAVCHYIAVFGHCHGVDARGNGDALARLASVPQVVGSHISVDIQSGGLVRTDAVGAINEEVGRDINGGEAHLVAPVAVAVRTAVGADLDRIVRSRFESAQQVGVLRNEDGVGFVAVDADLPFGGAAVLGPVQCDVVFGDAGCSQIRGCGTSYDRGTSADHKQTGDGGSSASADVADKLFLGGGGIDQV